MQACGDPQDEYFIVSGRHIWSEEPLIKHTTRVKGNSVWETEGSGRKERSGEMEGGRAGQGGREVNLFLLNFSAVGHQKAGAVPVRTNNEAGEWRASFASRRAPTRQLYSQQT